LSRQTTVWLLVQVCTETSERLLQRRLVEWVSRRETQSAKYNQTEDCMHKLRAETP